jgi:hypothetical protein
MMSSEPIVGDKRSAPDAPDTSDDDGSQPERGKDAEAAGPKLDQAERQRNKKLRRDGEARNLSREERKMPAIMRQIDEMEQKEKTVKAGPCSTQREASVGNVNEKVGEKRRFREAYDAVAGETAGQELRGEGGDGAGGEKLDSKRKKAANHKRDSFQGKGKEEAVEKRKRPSSEEGHEAQEQQHGDGVGSSRASGEDSKRKREKCPHNRNKSECKACGGASICEHNRIRSQCKQCGGASICEHSRIRSG